MSRDWTEELFIKYGDIFLRLLEGRLPQVEGEVESLIKIFSEFQLQAETLLLDLCCGIGGHSINLASRGFHVTGVDISPQFIEYAKRVARDKGVWERTCFIEGDARKIKDLLKPRGGKFNAIINMNTSIGYWTDDVDRSILKQLNDLAKPGCLLIIDITNKDGIIRQFHPFSISTIDGTPTYFFTQERKLVLETSRMENAWTFYRKEGDDLMHVVTIPIDHRMYSLHELVALFNETGWNYLKAFGSFMLEPVTFDTSRMIIVGRKMV